MKSTNNEVLIGIVKQIDVAFNVRKFHNRQDLLVKIFVGFVDEQIAVECNVVFFGNAGQKIGEIRRKNGETHLITHFFGQVYGFHRSLAVGQNGLVFNKCVVHKLAFKN